MRLVMVAGGTGGHITPAIAFGQWRESRGDEVLYICGSRPLESEIYSRHGIEPRILPLEGSPLGTKNFGKRISRSFSMISSFFSMLFFFKKKRPHMVVLFGGYVSLPALMVCKLLSIPLLIHEQNAVAGKVTKLAHRMGFPVAKGWHRCDGVTADYTGIPIRPVRTMNRSEALKELGLAPETLESKILIFVIGGSLGSSPLIPSVFSASSMVESAGCVYICLGHAGTVSSEESRLIGLPPCWDMSPVYEASDIVICRAGGSTLAEIAFYGIPAIVVPWEMAADGHQEANARCFFEEGAKGALWHPDLGPERLAKEIKKLSACKVKGNSPRGYSDEGALALLWRLIMSHV